MEARIRPPLAWTALAVAALVALLGPFFVVDVPAILDYPNHLARFYVLTHPRDLWLSHFYAPQWGVLPNLGLDVIGVALVKVAPVHVAGRIVLALSLVAPVVGAVLHARAAFGRWTWWSLGAAVIAFNGVFFLGFMNFLLSVGVAMAGAAAWRVLSRRNGVALLAAVGALTGVLAFFCHLLGFAFFGLLIAAQEAEEMLGRWRDGTLAYRPALQRAAALGGALAPALALYLVSRQPPAAIDRTKWAWGAKIREWLMPFLTYDRSVTALTALVVLGAVILLWRDARRASGAVAALALLALAYLLGPFSVAGGYCFDARMATMAGFVLFAAIAPRPSRRAGMVVGAAFAALLLVRSAEVTTNWREHARDLAEFRQTIARVEPGAAVLVAETPIDQMHGRAGRVLQGYSRLDWHLPALLVIERHAFWPLFFAHSGQQPVRVLPPYDRMATPAGQPVAWPALFPPEPRGAELQQYPYLVDWRRRFDYVLLLGPPPHAVPAGVSLLRPGAETSLYRIQR